MEYDTGQHEMEQARRRRRRQDDGEASSSAFRTIANKSYDNSAASSLYNASFSAAFRDKENDNGDNDDDDAVKSTTSSTDTGPSWFFQSWGRPSRHMEQGPLLKQSQQHQVPGSVQSSISTNRNHIGWWYATSNPNLEEDAARDDEQQQHPPHQYQFYPSYPTSISVASGHGGAAPLSHSLPAMSQQYNHASTNDATTVLPSYAGGGSARQSAGHDDDDRRHGWQTCKTMTCHRRACCCCYCHHRPHMLAQLNTTQYYTNDSMTPYESPSAGIRNAPTLCFPWSLIAILLWIVLLALSYTHDTIVLRPGESRQVNTKILNRYMVISTHGATPVNVYAFYEHDSGDVHSAPISMRQKLSSGGDATCPALNGPRQCVSLQRTVSLQGLQYEWDAFYLTSGSTLNVTATQGLGRTRLAVMQGDKILQRLRGDATLRDEDRFGPAALQSQLASADNMSHLRLGPVKSSDSYVVVYDNLADTGAQLDINVHINRTTYNLQDQVPWCHLPHNATADKDSAALCMVGVPARRKNCILVAAAYTNRNSTRVDQDTLVTVYIRSQRNWLALCFYAMLPMLIGVWRVLCRQSCLCCCRQRYQDYETIVNAKHDSPFMVHPPSPYDIGKKTYSSFDKTPQQQRPLFETIDERSDIAMFSSVDENSCNDGNVDESLDGDGTTSLEDLVIRSSGDDDDDDMNVSPSLTGGDVNADEWSK